MTAEHVTIAPNWQSESLRLSAFLAPDVRVRDENWWSRVVGNEPETKTIKSVTGQILEAGTFEGSALTFSAQPGRVDWVLSPSQMQFQDDEIAIKTIGHFPEIIASFSRLMNVWLNICPPILRLAFGAVLLEGMDSKEAGYRRLSEFLRTVEIDESSRDLFYQVNRPRLLKGINNELEVNRLSKWSVAALQVVRMAFSLAGQPPIAPALYASPESLAYACRLELDLSTPGERQNDLTRDRLSAIFGELVSLGVEIAGTGDVR